MPSARYRADTFCRPNELFHINLFSELTRETAIYHSHDFVELSYVFSGTGVHIQNGKEYPVRKGDFFIINYDVEHMFYRDTEESPLLVYNIIFKPAFFDNLLINFNDFNTLALSQLFKFNEMEEWDSARSDLRLEPDEQKPFNHLFENMLNEYENTLPGYLNILRGYMIELIVRVLRLLNQSERLEDLSSDKTDKIKSIINYLKDNYSVSFSLSDLALQTFFSKNYICKIFKETTGMTVKEYVHILRIEEACTLMSESDWKLTDIAMKVGFSDYKNFFDVFKKIKKVSPHEFKKQLKT